MHEKIRNIFFNDKQNFKFLIKSMRIKIIQNGAWWNVTSKRLFTRKSSNLFSEFLTTLIVYEN